MLYIYIYVHICAHTYTLVFRFFYIQVITEFPVLYSRSLLVIYLIYSSMYMSILTSQLSPFLIIIMEQHFKKTPQNNLKLVLLAC